MPGVSNTYDQNVVSFNAISQALGTFAAATRTGFNQVMNKSATVSLLTTGTVYFEAVAGTGVGAGNNILFNERNPSTLARLGTTFFAFGEDVNTISWQNINQNAYLAVGGPTLLKIYLLNPSAVTLSQVLSTNAFGAVNSISWQNIGGTYYLALGGTSSMNVVSFNSTASTVTSVATYPGSTQSVSGGASSYFINLVLAQGSTVRVLAVDRYSSAGNFFLNNISQGNMTGYYEGCSPSSPNQWLGNLGVGNATNFSIASQFPISAATGTGVGTAENIDASLITGGPAEKIMRTVVDQAAPTIAQVSTFIQCQPTYISGATTLSGNSYYALGRAVDGQITLNGVSNVSLNLMGRRVRNILVQNCSRITILNGYISGGGVASALDVDGSTNIHLQNLVVTGATYGLRVQNNTTNITAENCLFNSNATAGVQIESGRGNSFMYCTANKNGTNGFVFTGTGHTATYCFANRNTVGAGFKILANSIANEVRSCSACVNATGYDYAITTSNIAISNFASGNTSANYVTNIRWGVTTATSGGSANYTSNVQI